MKDDAVAAWEPKEILDRLAADPARRILSSVSGGEARPVTARNLLGLAGSAATKLAAAEIGRGDVVAIWAENSPGWLAAVLACSAMGVVFAPIDMATPADEVSTLLDQIGARALFANSDAAVSLGPGPMLIAIDRLDPAAAAPACEALPADAPMALFRTSGTTGTPKKFFLSRSNIAAGVAAIVGWGGVRADDRVLQPLPMHHVYPLITGALSGLTIGAELILPEAPTGPHIAEAMRLTRPTVVIGVPRLFEAMLAGIEARLGRIGKVASALYHGAIWLALRLRRATGDHFGAFVTMPFRMAISRDLRMLVSGGAAMKPASEEALEALGWDLRSGYGLSETAAAFTATFHGKRHGSPGQPIGGGQIRIDRPNAEGIGEILLKGPTVFAGYLDNSAANATAFDADGFFRTGDLGRVDGDGYLFVTGRAKEVIVLSGGDNLYPEDVEERYLAHEWIAEIGVMEKDGALVALVVPNLAETARAGILEIEHAMAVAAASVAKSLPSTWRLSGVAATREPLPRTRLGKLRRFKLPTLYDAARTRGAAAPRRPIDEADRRWIATPPRAAVWAILERMHPGEALSLETRPDIDLGLDSFAWMTLAVEIGQATDVTLTLEDIAGIETLRDLLEAVTRKAASPEHAALRIEERLAETRAWLAPRSALERLGGSLTYRLNRLLIRSLFGLRVTGAEHLTVDGPLLICPNHMSDLDPLVVAAAIPPSERDRTVWAADRARVFRTAAMRWICRRVRIYPVEETMPTLAVDIASDVLGEGGIQIWFPEGWRSADGRLLPFRPGIGVLVDRAHPRVVPAIIHGTLDAWPRERAYPRPRPVSITFGAPIDAATLIAESAGGEGSAAEAIAAALRRRIAELGAQQGMDIG